MLQHAVVLLILSKKNKENFHVSSNEIQEALRELKAHSTLEIARVIRDYEQQPTESLLTRGFNLYTQNTSSNIVFIRLPDEIKSSIFEYLDNPSCRAMRQVSIRSHELTNKLWRRQMLLAGVQESDMNVFYKYYDTLDVPSLTIEVNSINSNLFKGLIQSLMDNERIKEVKLTVKSDKLESADVPQLAKLTKLIKLDISGNNLADSSTQLAGLTNLTWLNINDNRLDSNVTAQLTNLTKLASLYIGDNELLAAGVAHLGKLTTLTMLDIANNALGSDDETQPADLTALASMTNLTTLDICDNALTSYDVAHLANLTNLTELNIAANRFGSDGAEHLANLTNLNSLIIFGSYIGPNGAAYLRNLTNLTSLDISGNDIRVKGAACLASLRKLISLTIDDNKLGLKGAAHIANLPNLTELCTGFRGNFDAFDREQLELTLPRFTNYS
jgi:Leucine-rich repeat (LRR) protein